jgi:protein SCO1/2
MSNSNPDDTRSSFGLGGLVAALVVFAGAGVALWALPLLFGKPKNAPADRTGITETPGTLKIGTVTQGEHGREITLAPASGDLPIIGSVPEFDLEESRGGRLRRADLLGKVWMVDFIFTNCHGVCPDMSLAMAGLQSALEGEADVRFVSVSIDPARDTMDVMRDYSARYKAQPGRWYFAGGGPGEGHALAFHGFHLGDEKDPLIHSGKCALVDRLGRIRGYYEAREDEGRTALIRDARRLLVEPTPEGVASVEAEKDPPAVPSPDAD